MPPARLRQVLLHPSQAEHRSASYERLEFLGDSILGYLVAQVLYERFPEFSEGELSRLRSSVVSRRSCAAVARETGLDRLFAERAGPNEELRRSDNVAAALTEAAIAALVLEHGLRRVAGPILDAFEGEIESAVRAPADFKTRLQEEAAKLGWRVAYSVVAAEGPPHERWFTCEVVVDGRRLGVGSGRSKKEAQQVAAAEALEALPVAPELP